MSFKRMPEDKNPFETAVLPIAFGPEAGETVSSAVATALDKLSQTPAPFLQDDEEDGGVFEFAFTAAREDATDDVFVGPAPSGAAAAFGAGASGGNAPGDLDLPDAAFSGVSIEEGDFTFARPTEGTGGKPPKGDSGDGGTGGLLTSYTSGGNAKTSYNITVTFEGGNWTQAWQQFFIDAADYLSTIVVGDISDERVPLFGRVDDLTIEASVVSIDGAGNVLGGASVFASRIGNDLPAASIMQFDVADIDAAVTNGYFYHVVLHEMVHAMGFGGKWESMGLVDWITQTDENGAETDVFRFTGQNATNEYNKLAAADADVGSLGGVLVETDWNGGTNDGTNFVHWDEATFGEMLMTGIIDTRNPGNPELSTMTIAALEDMGYDTIYVPDAALVLA